MNWKRQSLWTFVHILYWTSEAARFCVKFNTVEMVFCNDLYSENFAKLWNLQIDVVYDCNLASQMWLVHTDWTRFFHFQQKRKACSIICMIIAIILSNVFTMAILHSCYCYILTYCFCNFRTETNQILAVPPECWCRDGSQGVKVINRFSSEKNAQLLTHCCMNQLSRVLARGWLHVK